jgi:hypothetical protein
VEEWKIGNLQYVNSKAASRGMKEEGKEGREKKGWLGSGCLLLFTGAPGRTDGGARRRRTCVSDARTAAFL